MFCFSYIDTPEVTITGIDLAETHVYLDWELIAGNVHHRVLQTKRKRSIESYDIIKDNIGSDESTIKVVKEFDLRLQNEFVLFAFEVSEQETPSGSSPEKEGIVPVHPNGKALYHCKNTTFHEYTSVFPLHVHYVFHSYQNYIVYVISMFLDLKVSKYTIKNIQCIVDNRFPNIGSITSKSELHIHVR